MKEYLLHKPLLKTNFCSHTHDHTHEHNHSHFDARTTDKKILIVSLIMTSSMMIVQFVYSLLSNSLALLSDTLHMFSDVFALFLSYVAIIAVQNFKNKQKTFGYFRLEILVAFINALSIIVSAAFIIYEAINKLLNPVEIDTKTMMIVAFAGLLVNAINGFMMFKYANLNNINMKSAFLHMLSDLFGSLCVVIGGVIVYFTDIVYIDTILAIILSLLLLKWSIFLLKQSVNILLESSPVDIKDVESTLLEHNEILEVVDLHIIEITNEMFVAFMHLKLSITNLDEFEDLYKKVSQILLEKFKIGHITIQPLRSQNEI